MVGKLKALAFGLLLAITALTLACGSSKSGGGKQTFDPKQADAEAHAALLKENELPGSGWKAGQDDQFSGDDDLPSVSACNDMNAFQADAKKSQAARARREFDRATAGAVVPASVAVDVHIYNTADEVASLLKRFKSLANSGKVSPCLVAFFQDQLKDANIAVKEAPPSNKAPNNGIALAFDLTAGPLTLRAENYQWTEGNGVLETTFTGLKDGITNDLISATNQKLSDAASQVAKGARSR
jgi:hypothetical protein